MAEYLAFAGNHPFLIAAAVLLVIIIIVSEIRRARRPWKELGPLEAVRLINSGAQLVDIRGHDAYRAGHIVNARHIPAAELGDKASKLDAGKPVVVYCDTGMSSGRAAATLTGHGFGEVYSLRGGLAAWKQENMPVAKD